MAVATVPGRQPVERVGLQKRDERTGADKLPIEELPYGRRAALYRGRRLHVDQLHYYRSALQGIRWHREHWVSFYVLLGQIELRLYYPDHSIPFLGLVLTSKSEPYPVRAQVGYEVLALTEASVIVSMGNYHDCGSISRGDVIQATEDEPPRFDAAGGEA